jgi:hypothetical protein
MRSICKKGPAILVTALALCALTAASASAAQWYVGGKALTSYIPESAKLAKSIKVEEPIVISVPAAKLAIKCTGLQFGETAPAEIKQTKTLDVEFLYYTGCATTEPASGCALREEGYFKGDYLEGEAATAAKSPEDELVLTRIPIGFLAEVYFAEGDKCAVLNSLQQFLQSHVTFTMPKGREEAAEQTFVAQGTKESPDGLTFLKDPAYLTGKFKLKLESGKAWSFH